MLTCFCGNILVSNGSFWHCPIKGGKTAFDKDGVHKGTIIVDKRQGQKKSAGQ